MFIALLVAAILVPGAALAQGPAGREGIPAPAVASPDSGALAPVTEWRIGTVHVTGNSHTDSVRIVRTFDVLPGSRYADEAVRRGIRKLFALGLFNDVAVEKALRGERMDLIIVVKERPRIAKVEFRGNRKCETADLEKNLTLRAGEVYSPVAVQTQVDSLLRYCRKRGFARATVEASTDGAAGGDVNLRFAIQEGAKVRITRIEFVGAQAFPPKALRKRLKTRAKGFFGGGDVKEEEAAEDREKLEAFYQDRGYKDMRVVSRKLRSGLGGAKDTSAVVRETLVVTVDEGPLYRVKRLTWTGNRALTTDELKALWNPKWNRESELHREPGPSAYIEFGLRVESDARETEPNGRSRHYAAGVRASAMLYQRSVFEEYLRRVYEAYAEKGHLYVNIPEPEEAVLDSGVIALTFHVTESEPSRVRYVNITGNRGTREKVIRRELSLREGDRFKRSALMRTQGDLSRLGLFEEVIPDFAPAESTDVDINIRVKEKQVGTASAGAGYTGQTGFTGFLELGHNNVLGNGQALALHLERGSRRSNYSLSFTEPWFRGSPTLLGMSAFNMSTELDLYKEQRRGGSARIGRPLPWPDYSRGSIGYSLEDVTIRQYGSTLSGQDSIVFSGIATGRPVRTSSAILNFSRNSTDNAFYPTRGTRLSWTSELAGGPFLGGVSFIKNRVEGRLYLPSFVRGVTTMARARVGVLGIWAGQRRGLPPYERFRLGGGSVADPLRGYDDYMVVPEKFVQEIRTRTGIASIDSVTAPGVRDTLYNYVTNKVRYPGGRYMALYSLEQQFPIVSPLRGVVFFDAGATWDQWREIQPLRLKTSIGIGFRMEIPMLGNIGFDYGYGFNRDDGPRGRGHFLLGAVSF